MDIYIAVWYDRHIDDQLFAFTILEDAEAKCEEFMEDSSYHRYGKWMEDADFKYDDDWVYYIVFENCEGSDAPHAYVRKVKLEDENEPG